MTGQHVSCTQQRGSVLNKNDLIRELADRMGTAEADARRWVDELFGVIHREVGKGGKVAIAGHGIYERVTRGARTARNPATGNPVDVPETTVPKFRAGATFKAHVAGTPSGDEPAS